MMANENSDSVLVKINPKLYSWLDLKSKELLKNEKCGTYWNMFRIHVCIHTRT